MIELNTETFAPAIEPSKNAEKYGWNEGSVEVTFHGKTQRVRCLAPSESRDYWMIYGLCARYATGSKVWHASLTFKGGRVTHISTGFENRSGRFSQPRLVGFIENVSEQHVSKR
jgi:hypothetical protein